MSAPTLWEEGRMSGSRVVRLAALAGALVLVLDVALFGHPTVLFDLAFVVVCVASALAVRPRDFFVAGVLPPLLLLGLVLAVALVQRDWVATSSDGVPQAVVSGLAHRATALLAAYLLALGVLGVRQHMLAKRAAGAPVPHLWEDAEPQATNLATSPAPTRVTTGEPSEKSTTVVGSEPHSPESMTASSQ